MVEFRTGIRFFHVVFPPQQFGRDLSEKPLKGKGFR